MTLFCKSSLVALCLTLGTVTFALAEKAVSPPEAGELYGDARSVPGESKHDPPGLLNDRGVGNLRGLAAQLSADRGWLTPEVLKGLDQMTVRLDEIFAEAPNFIEIKGKLYRVALEKVGPAWASFDARSRYLIFLNHEIYDRLGADRALAFEGGEERVITEADLEKTPAIGLTLKDVTPDDKPKSRSHIVGLDSSFQLGAVEPRLRGPEEKALFLPEPAAGNKSCSYIGAPASCSNGVPVCSSPTASPYFVLSALRIKTDHEGAFQGDPEIELFPLRINATSPAGGSTDVRTNWIFEGRYVTDLAGRSVYLPDVDNNNQWYSIANGLALFPAAMSNSWVSTLVDNDDTTGLLELDRNRNNPVKFPLPSITVNTPLDDFDILKGIGILLIALGILDNSDDLYVQSLEVSNNLFCSQGLGQPFPYNFLLTGTEWDLQGHFACIDPACIPDPCAGDPCCGDPCCGSRCCGDPYCIEP